MTTTAKELVAKAKAGIRNLTAIEVQAHLMQGVVTLVDVREREEQQEHGVIAGSFHAPRGLLEFWADPESPLHRPELDPSDPIIVYCAAGSRSALAVEALERLGYAEVAHLDGGIAAWKQAGLPVASSHS